jgi:hypothetical protein
VTKRTRIALAALAAAALLAGLILAITLSRRPPPASAGKKDASEPIALAVSDIPPEPSIWIDVHAPGRIWKWLRENPWLARAMAEPLGQGMAAGWSGFLATKGADLAGAFEGAVLDLVAGRLLSDPFRVVFFAGPEATGAPAVLVPRPSSTALAAHAILESVARTGRYEAPRCPGPAPEKPAKKTPPLSISRWLVAEHALFAGLRDGRLALGRSPGAVVQALCAAPPEEPATDGADASLSFAPAALGRPAQLAGALLGLGPSARMAFAVNGDRLEPRGLTGSLADPGRLETAAPPTALLRLLPADAGLVLVATLRLPEELTRDSLVQHLGKRYRGRYAPRPIALVWNPRGREALATEVAVVWPEKDAAALRDAFSGPNRMEQRRACGHLVFASTRALAGALQAGCEGKAPSLLDAAPAVASGLAQPASIAVGLNSGVTLSRLLGDARAGTAQGKAPPPEIQSARRLLEELPFFGLRGVARGGALAPGGFRS